MFCENCGCELAEKSVFCLNCGAKITGSQEPEASFVGEPEKETPDPAPADVHISPNLTRSPDGTIRWIYELSLWKNPTIILTVWKVLLICSGFVGLLMFSVTLGDGFGEAIKISLSVFGMTAGIITGLMLVAYPIFCAANGGKYCVLFEMDHKGIKHTQLSRQFDKAQAMGLLTAFVGGIKGNFSAAGAGLLSATHNSVYTSFNKVKKVSVKEKRNVIYIGETLEQNQVYVETADFRLVCDYILEHCNKKAKIKNRRRR